MSGDWQVVEEALYEHEAEYGVDPEAVLALARLREREAACTQALIEVTREKNAAEARVAELEEALEAIRVQTTSVRIEETARRALAHEEEK